MIKRLLSYFTLVLAGVCIVAALLVAFGVLEPVSVEANTVFVALMALGIAFIAVFHLDNRLAAYLAAVATDYLSEVDFNDAATNQLFDDLDRLADALYARMTSQGGEG